jgi:hypothetical protein
LVGSNELSLVVLDDRLGMQCAATTGHVLHAADNTHFFRPIP